MAAAAVELRYDDDRTVHSGRRHEDARAWITADLRPFPNEHICWWVKDIDNSRVSRQADPRFWDTCWRFVSSASLAVVIVMGLLLPNAYSLLEGYRVQELREERARLENRKRRAETDFARLTDPRRLEVIAARQGYVDPPANSIHFLNEPMAEGVEHQAALLPQVRRTAQERP